jgi:hypothetical protein
MHVITKDPIDMSHVNLRKETRPEASGFPHHHWQHGCKYPGFLKKKHFPEWIPLDRVLSITLWLT